MADEQGKNNSISKPVFIRTNDKYSVLVNKTHAFDEYYLDMVRIIKRMSVNGDERAIESETSKALDELIAFADTMGIRIGFCSGYRSIAYQQMMLDTYPAIYDDDFHPELIAPPGYSEHHTGLAVDLAIYWDGRWVEDNYTDEVVAALEKLHPYMHRFGFILRYPEGLEDITGYPYEPWHIRYVGKDAAPAYFIEGRHLPMEQPYQISDKQTLLRSDEAREALDAARTIINDPDKTKIELEVVPGNAALKICPDILNEISEDMHSIIVTGTNGKTTVARMIASILDEAGIDYIANREGANMENRITGLYCGNFDPSAGPVKKTAVIECDEGYLRLVMPRINPLCLIITCIYPDQLERFGSEEHVAELICEGMRMTTPATCIVAQDCHFLEDKICRVPDWSFITYDAPDDGQKYELNIPGAFNQKNAVAAARVGHILGISEGVIRKGLAKVQPAFGRFETFDYGKSHITICLAKNTAGFEAVSGWLSECETGQIGQAGQIGHVGQKKPKQKRQIIIAMNANAGDDKDTAWLKDNDYSKVMHTAVSIIVTGTCADIVMDEMTGNVAKCEMASIPDVCADFAGETIIVANYTAMMQIRELFVSLGKLRPYWED